MGQHTSLIRPIRSVAWELRGAWARGLRVALSLDDRCDMPRLEGHVRRVAATDAFVEISGVHVPLDAVLAVHRPSRLGDSSFEDGRWHGRHYIPPQREELPL